jgi:hypothetical protein
MARFDLNTCGGVEFNLEQTQHRPTRLPFVEMASAAPEAKFVIFEPSRDYPFIEGSPHDGGRLDTYDASVVNAIVIQRRSLVFGKGRGEAIGRRSGTRRGCDS